MHTANKSLLPTWSPTRTDATTTLETLPCMATHMPPLPSSRLASQAYNPRTHSLTRGHCY
eukprot:9577321-Alexandrium_andersonii.AAC.1